MQLSQHGTSLLHAAPDHPGTPSVHQICRLQSCCLPAVCHLHPPLLVELQMQHCCPHQGCPNACCLLCCRSPPSTSPAAASLPCLTTSSFSLRGACCTTGLPRTPSHTLSSMGTSALSTTTLQSSWQTSSQWTSPPQRRSTGPGATSSVILISCYPALFTASTSADAGRQAVTMGCLKGACFARPLSG